MIRLVRRWWRISVSEGHPVSPWAALADLRRYPDDATWL